MNKNTAMKKRVSLNSDTVDEGHERMQWEGSEIGDQKHNHTQVAKQTHMNTNTHMKKVWKTHTNAILTLECEWQEKKSGRLFYLAQLKRQKAQTKGVFYCTPHYQQKGSLATAA